MIATGERQYIESVSRKRFSRQRKRRTAHVATCMHACRPQCKSIALEDGKHVACVYDVDKRSARAMHAKVSMTSAVVSTAVAFVAIMNACRPIGRSRAFANGG